MPIYEYRCTKEECNLVQESIEKIGTNTIQCKECGSPADKTMGSFLFNAHGLPNGHIGVRTKKPEK